MTKGKFWAIVIGIALITFAGYELVHYIDNLRSAKINAELSASKQQRINDTTIVRLTTSAAQKDSLEGILTATKALNGKLLAAVKLHVPIHDTLIQHDSMPTNANDGIRTASFTDSTFAGKIEGTVTAPPYPDPLQIAYKLTRYPFNPTIGFVKTGDKVRVVVVSSGGDSVEVEAPYFMPLPKKLRPIGGFAAIEYNPFSNDVTVSGGARVTLSDKLNIQAGLTTNRKAIIRGNVSF